MILMAQVFVCRKMRQSNEILMSLGQICGGGRCSSTFSNPAHSGFKQTQRLMNHKWWWKIFCWLGVQLKTDSHYESRPKLQWPRAQRTAASKNTSKRTNHMQIKTFTNMTTHMWHEETHYKYRALHNRNIQRTQKTDEPLIRSFLKWECDRHQPFTNY